MCVQAAARCGHYDAVDELLRHKEVLHVNVNKDFFPNAMRKVAAVGAPVDVLRRLLEREQEVRGSNSADAYTQVLKAYRKARKVESVRRLYEQAQAHDIELKPAVEEDLQAWLERNAAV